MDPPSFNLFPVVPAPPAFSDPARSMRLSLETWGGCVFMYVYLCVCPSCPSVCWPVYLSVSLSAYLFSMRTCALPSPDQSPRLPGASVRRSPRPGWS